MKADVLPGPTRTHIGDARERRLLSMRRHSMLARPLMPTLPKPRPVVRVGIVGHTNLPDVAQVRRRLHACLAAIREHAAKCTASPTARPLYATDVPEYRFVSNLAPGADQLATDVARGLGYVTTAILPIPRSDYEGELRAPGTEAAREQLAAFVRAVEEPDLRVLELPPARGGYGHTVADAYAFAARMLTDHVDVLIAVWSGPRGELARGDAPSLTRRVIDLAQRRNVPVVWVDSDPPRDADASALGRELAHGIVGGAAWSDDTSVHAALHERLRALLDPYAGGDDGNGTASLRPDVTPRMWHVVTELWHQLRGRHAHAKSPAEAHRQTWRSALEAIEPAPGSAWSRRLRLALARRSPFAWLMRRAEKAVPPSARATPPPPAAAGPPSVVHAAMDAADREAADLMHLYRGNFSWIFVLGATAVLLAVLAYLFKPHLPVLGKSLAILEVGAVGAVLLLYVGAHVNGWQRRAIEMRLVAEMLRQASWISRCFLVLPRPRLAGHEHGPGEPLRWSQWYAQSVLRDFDFGFGGAAGSAGDEGLARKLAATDLPRIRDRIVDGLVAEQHRWYTRKAAVHERFHGGLHSTEVRLFFAVLLACLLSVLLAFLMPAKPEATTAAAAPGIDWFAVAMAVLVTITAGFPAIAAAAHGLSAQSELHRIVSTYRRMEATLGARLRSLEALGDDFTLADLQREVAEASATMLAEVQDWQRSYGVHPPPLA